MTYQIKIDEAYDDDFVNILQSLKNIGLVRSIKRKNIISLEKHDLISILEKRDKEITEGDFLTQAELVKFLKLWKMNK